MAKVSAFNSFHSMGVPSIVALPQPKKAAPPYYIDEKRAKKENHKEDEIIPQDFRKSCDFKTKCKIAALNVSNVLTE